MEQVSAGVMAAWTLAASEAASLDYAMIEPEHLFLGLCKLVDAPEEEILGRMNLGDNERWRLDSDIHSIKNTFELTHLDPRHLRRQLRTLLGRGTCPFKGGTIHRSEACRQIFETARQLRRASGDRELTAVHLLEAITTSPPERVAALLDGADIPAAVRPGPRARRLRPATSRPGRPTPILDQYGRDLTLLAQGGILPKVIGRSKEMRRVAQVLCQKERNCVILVGEAGVGKTCVIEGLAQRIAEGGVQPALAGLRIVQVEPSGVVGGTRHRGDFEERLRGILEEAASPEIVLFIDEIHTLIGAGATGRDANDAANILKPVLSRGDVKCVGATTLAEYRQYIEKDAAFQRRFQVVWVEEPTRDEAVEMLNGLRTGLQEHHDVEVSDDAVAAAVDLSVRYLPDLRLPDKAAAVLDQACAQKRVSSISVPFDQDGERPGAAMRLDAANVAEVVAEMARIPVERILGGTHSLATLEERLRKRVVGQDAALRDVVACIRVARSGLVPRRGPEAVLLFLGPSGTGKSELAKALADELYDDLIRVDMSEFQEKQNVARFIGAPPGYVGFGETSVLSRGLRARPHSVVLLDEVEKAHPEVWDLFLQVFEEGCLTDGQGRRIDFSQAAVVMTSNLGAQPAAAIGPFGDVVRSETAYRESVEKAVQKTFRKELLGRIGRHIVFYPLAAAALRDLTQRMQTGLAAALARDGIVLEVADAVLDLIIEKGTNREQGVRCLQRTFEELLAVPIAEERGSIDSRSHPVKRIRVRLERGNPVVDCAK